MRPLRNSLLTAEALQLRCGAVDRGLSRRCAGDAATKLNTKPLRRQRRRYTRLSSSENFGGV